MEHTVRKSKANRVAMRITAMVFLLVGGLSFWTLVSGERSSGRILFGVLCAVCITYGAFLFVQTLKNQAYDITYVFGEQVMTLKMRHKELTVGYDHIGELSYVVPNENMDYGVVQLYIGKEQYVIPFMGNRNVGEALYGMLKLKKEEMSQEKADGQL